MAAGYEVVIFGSGLSGMISALSFAQNKINVTIIEAKNTNSPQFTDDIRTTALTNYSKSYLESVGVWELIKDHIGPINDIYVVDNKEPEILHFASSSLKEGEIMGYLIKNSEFKNLLLDAVKNNSYIKLIDQVSYQKIDNNDDYCLVHLTNTKSIYQIKADLLVVCDGYQSLAKKLFFTPKMEKYYGQHALTFITSHQKSHEGTAVEHFMPSGPFAILPLPDKHQSSIVWTVKSAEAEALLALDTDEFTYLVQKNFGPFLGEIKIVGKIASFPLKAYETKKYFNKNIVLIADTAHTIHPLAGQGLNQGIKDIEALVNSIMVHGISASALLNYQHLRQSDNNIMLTLTDTLNSVFSTPDKPLRKARQLGFQLIEKIPPLKKMIIKYAMGKR